jgi:hypothetical protein
MIDYLRRLQEEQKQLVCDWKSMKTPAFLLPRSRKMFVSPRRKYSTVMKQTIFCVVEEDYFAWTRQLDDHVIDIYDCRPRDNVVTLHSDTDEQVFSKKPNLMACKLTLKTTTKRSRDQGHSAVIVRIIICIAKEKSLHVEAHFKPKNRHNHLEKPSPISSEVTSMNERINRDALVFQCDLLRSNELKPRTH